MISQKGTIGCVDYWTKILYQCRRTFRKSPSMKRDDSNEPAPLFYFTGRSWIRSLFNSTAALGHSEC